MKKNVFQLITLTVGLAIGVGTGMMISNSKIEKKQEIIEQLTTELKNAQDDKAKSEELIKKVSDENARNKNKFEKAQRELFQIRNQQNVLMEQFKKLQTQAGGAVSGQSAAPVTITNPAAARPPAAAGAKSTTVKTVDYTVKDGDSFWKIAEEKLGNGIRYQEILDLNPNINEKEALKIGMKLKIPAE